MEDDCFKEINLEPNPYHQDGGVKRGFGWLERYWVRSHPRVTPQDL